MRSSLIVTLMQSTGKASAERQKGKTIALTAGDIVYGELDLALGVVLTASLSAGSRLGAKLAHAAPQAVLRAIVSGALVIFGLFIPTNAGRRRIE